MLCEIFCESRVKRNRVQYRDALLLNELQTPSRLKAFHEHQARAGHRGQAHQHNAINMVERNEDQQAILKGNTGRSNRLDCITDKVFTDLNVSC